MVRSSLSLLVVAGCFLAAGARQAAGAADKAADADAAKRKALWAALLKACPQEYRQIDVYAEDPSLTRVCFRSGDHTLLFSLKKGKVEVVNHSKALPAGAVNRITFEGKGDRASFILWRNGERELDIAVGGE